MKRSITRMQDPMLKLPRHTLLAHSVRYLGVLLASLLCSLNIQALEPKKVLGFGDVLEPQPYQVFQRDRIDSGPIRIRACLPAMDQSISSMEWSWVADGVASAWFPLAVQWDDTCFQAQVRLPAGGWYTLRLRDRDDRAKTHEIKYIGVGEVFVVAGQSNAANHGEAIMEPRSDRVVSLSQDGWQPAKDPQPGASGRRGSFMPTLGDKLVDALGVPIGFVACGLGATSVREWLPAGDTFDRPPTLEGRVKHLDDGRWMSGGEAFDHFMHRVDALGIKGFRAVLWHQGESDANQRDPGRTLPGEDYAKMLSRIISATRAQLGWEVPWFVAQTSYHVPGDEASPDIRRAQASMWKPGLALQGPDTDALKGMLRESYGQGVHFSREGLIAHGQAWAHCLLPWLTRATDQPSSP